jgi:hypothetical protein
MMQGQLFFRILRATLLAGSFALGSLSIVSAATAQNAPQTEAIIKPSGLQSLVEPLWTDLNPQQRSVLEPFGAQWNTWSAQEKRVWVSLANKFPQYTPAQQAKAKQRIKDWAALSSEQRRLARSNYRMANQLPKEELADQKKRYEGMTHEQRVVLRENGSTSNTAAKYGGARTGLAKDAAKPFAGTQTAAAPATPVTNKGVTPAVVKQ